MSNHRPADDPGASLASIATGVVAVATTFGLSLYILWGPMDSRGIIGAALGFVLAVLLVAQTAARISDRLTAAERIKRHQARQGIAPIVVKPSTDLRAYAASKTTQEETVHASFEEEYGYDPGPTRLNSRGWPEPVSQEEAGPEPWRSDDTAVIRRDPTGEVGEETRRLDPGVYRSGPPSAAALRPIAVPVFRTEAERAAWADHHGLPTEVVPFQAYPDAEPDWNWTD